MEIEIHKANQKIKVIACVVICGQSMRNIPQRTIARLHQFIVHDRWQPALFPITFVYGFLRFHLRNQGLVAWLALLSIHKLVGWKQ